MRWYKGQSVAHDPDAIKTWRWDWTDWLSTGETISTHTVVDSGDLVVVNSVNDLTGVNVTLSAGIVDTSSDVTIRVTTSPSGQVDDRTVTFVVSEQ